MIQPEPPLPGVLPIAQTGHDAEAAITLPPRLAGKIILVAGGTRGMGEAAVRGIVAAGGKVLFGGRDTTAGRAIEADLSGAATFAPLDTTLEQDWARFVQVALDKFGGITGLVNCAGLSIPHALSDISLSDIHRLVAVNQIGVLLGMRAVVDAMTAAGAGSIVNIGSAAARRAYAGVGVYAGAKSAATAMSRTAAIEFAPRGIRVNVIHPGFFATRLLDEGTGGQGRARGEEVTPLKRVAAPEEIVGAIVFLLSDESAFVTGADLAVDGGLTA